MHTNKLGAEIKCTFLGNSSTQTSQFRGNSYKYLSATMRIACHPRIQIKNEELARGT